MEGLGLTKQLLLKTVNLSICIMNSFIEAKTQVGVLLRQGLVQVLLVVYILDCLIGPEIESSAGAFHDDAGVEATQDACLVVFSRTEICNDGIVGVGELGAACRASISSREVLASHAELTGTV